MSERAKQADSLEALALLAPVSDAHWRELKTLLEPVLAAALASYDLTEQEDECVRLMTLRALLRRLETRTELPDVAGWVRREATGEAARAAVGRTARTGMQTPSTDERRWATERRARARATAERRNQGLVRVLFRTASQHSASQT